MFVYMFDVNDRLLFTVFMLLRVDLGGPPSKYAPQDPAPANHGAFRPFPPLMQGQVQPQRPIVPGASQ